MLDEAVTASQEVFDMWDGLNDRFVTTQPIAQAALTWASIFFGLASSTNAGGGIAVAALLAAYGEIEIELASESEPGALNKLFLELKDKVKEAEAEVNTWFTSLHSADSIEPTQFVIDGGAGSVTYSSSLTRATSFEVEFHAKLD
eukprot:Lithocolla_globosa_v1_NODE_76_length_6846_cov_31.756737.p3 type:complete len:145 gc:universal NODE_76_length_6846_cov_31.756737:4676-4242(-)